MVTVLDARPPKEFAADHLPGAIDIPIRELEQRLAELPRRKEVVAYRRGPDCLISCDAVRPLRRKGLKAGRLPGSHFGDAVKTMEVADAILGQHLLGL